MATITLDLAGLKCPLPAMKTKKALVMLRTSDRLLAMALSERIQN